MLPCIPLSVIFLAFGPPPSLAQSHVQFNDPQPSLTSRASNFNVNPNGSSFLWLPQDEYSGKTFFDRFTFFNFSDPTHGQVNFVDAQTAFSEGLAYVQEDGVVIMKGDNTSVLAQGAFRNSVRIQSQAQYNTGLFILDLNRAPWGCGIWPAFWTVGADPWPYNGEIDIIEGVHDNQHNQVAWHTGPGCMMTPTANFTGTIVQSNGKNNLDCNGLINQNSGCGVTDWSRASYGPNFDAQGGGVFAMKWDENSIAIWSFYRAAIPPDITQGSPDPANWGAPSAVLESNNCDLLKFFKNHSIVFDITFCGDWAGSAVTSGCPGTCADRVMDPSNFANASWSINSLKVYRKQLINGQISSATTVRMARDLCALLLLAAISFMIHIH